VNRPLFLLVATILVASGAALAGTAVGPAPGGMHCVNVDTDSCVVGPYTAIAGYGWGFEGVFVGDLTLTTDAPGFHHAFVCKNVILAGGVLVDTTSVLFPDCHHEGVDPPMDLPVTMGCYSRGTGIVVCSLTG